MDDVECLLERELNIEATTIIIQVMGEDLLNVKDVRNDPVR